MELTLDTKVLKLLDTYPFLLDFLANYSNEFKKLKNPLLRDTMAQVTTLDIAASMAEVSTDTFLSDLNNEIAKHTIKPLIMINKDIAVIDFSKILVLKEIIHDLHEGANFNEVKGRFIELVKDVNPAEIAEMEQQLISEGLPESDIRRLCDVHVTIFRKSLDKAEIADLPPGHPIHTFRLENERILELCDATNSAMMKYGDQEIQADDRELIRSNLKRIMQIDMHYLRKEYQLFPFLEKHDFTGPSKVMWAIHDDIRTLWKELLADASDKAIEVIKQKSRKLLKMIEDMVYKENKVLFPASLQLLNVQEWMEIRDGESEIGYALTEPAGLWEPDHLELVVDEKNERNGVLNQLPLDAGLMSLEQINLMLKHLPVELSFVDENDEVRYYTQVEHKIFPRSPGVIGRKVQNCHPAKSVDMVNEILAKFRTGEEDHADFWMEHDGRFIHIRYFAVRDEHRKYRGTVEVVQDVSEIRKLEGSRRLLDWGK